MTIDKEISDVTVRYLFPVYPTYSTICFAGDVFVWQSIISRHCCRCVFALTAGNDIACVTDSERRCVRVVLSCAKVGDGVLRALIKSLASPGFRARGARTEAQRLRV